MSKKSETEELAEVTPFEEKDIKTESAFKNGNMFVETSAVQAETPMVPWEDPK